MSKFLKIVRYLVLALAVTAVVSGTVIVREVGSKSARIATRWACPCVYVEGRDLQYCMDALQIPVQGLVSVQMDDAEQSVEARSFLFFKSKARRVKGQSCIMEY